MAAGVDWLQLRDRTLEGAEYLAWAQLLVDAAPGACVIVNRRVDIALALGAAGVHLGFDALPASEAAALMPPGSAIGVSAHDPEELRAARESGATYAHLAPIWPPISKPPSTGPGRPPLGVAGLRAAAACGLPVLAQGGVTAARCGEVVDAGAAGVAVTGDILLADDPGGAAACLRAALDGAGG